MTELEFAALQRAATDGSTELEQRDVRALTEYMTILSLGGGVFSVTTQSGSEYHVDAEAERCTCPDWEYNLDGDGRCKHLRRVAFATGQWAIPAWVETEAIDPQLGLHVEGSPRVASTDGGTVTSPDADGETGGGEEDTDGCLCETTELGCFDHFEVSSE